MKKRFVRGGSVLIAMGLVLSGGAAALAAKASPDVAIKWTAGKKFTSPATRFDGVNVGGKVYFLGWRVDDAGTTDGSVVYYDIKTGKYVDTKTVMPVPVSNYEISVLKDKTGTGLYIFGGRNAKGNIIKTVQVYYPSTNKAMVVKSDPWPGTTPSKCTSLPGTGVATVGNAAYVVGGMSFSTSVPPCTDDNSAQVWKFDPMAAAGKKWSAEPALNNARGYVATAVYGTTIYAIGGAINSSGTLAPSQFVESWKVGSKSWNDKGVADLPQPCDESQAFAFAKGTLGGTITLTGCGGFQIPTADVLQYTVKTNKWAKDGALKEARRNYAAANIGTAKSPKFMIVGGYGDDGTTILQTTEIGTPSKGKQASFAGAAGLFASTARGAATF
jgi:hypothetical protein